MWEEMEDVEALDENDERIGNVKEGGRKRFMNWLVEVAEEETEVWGKLLG